MSSISPKSAQDVNLICNNLKSLGRLNKEWLDVSGAFPVARRKSFSFISRFWKPQNLRLATVYDKVVDFLQKNKNALMDPKYAESNLETLEHLSSFFSAKKNANLQIWPLKNLIDELAAREEELPKETPETILEAAKVESQNTIVVAQNKYAQFQMNFTQNVLNAQQELEQEKTYHRQIIDDAQTRATQEVGKMNSRKVADTYTYRYHRTFRLNKAHLHNVTLKSKQYSAVTTHALFFKTVVKDDSMVKPNCELDIFKGFSELVIRAFCQKIYRQPMDGLTAPQLAEYAKLLSHPALITDDKEIRSVVEKFKERIKEPTYGVRPLFELYCEISLFEGMDSIRGEFLQAIKQRIEEHALFSLESKVVAFNVIAESKRSQKEKNLFLLDFIKETEVVKILKEVLPQATEELKKHLYSMQDVSIQFKWLHNAFMLNDNTVKDKKAAFEYLSSLQDEHSRYQVAMCYYEGRGTDKNLDKAIELLMELFETKPSLVKDILQQMLLTRDVVDKHYIKFFEKTWVKHYADENQCKIRIRIAECYAEGRDFCPKDIGKAVEIYRGLMEHCVSKTIRDRAEFLLKSIPIEHFNEGANKGSEDDKKHMIDYFVENVQGSQKLITAETIKWLEEWSQRVALASGSISWQNKVQVILGTCYLNGYGVPSPKIDEGVELLKKALHGFGLSISNRQLVYANLNDFFIQNESDSHAKEIRQLIIGFLFVETNSISLRAFCKKESADWIEKWANDYAMWKDTSTTVHCLKAQWIIGEFYFSGLAGKKQDKSEASGYFWKASEHLPHGYYSPIRDTCQNRIATYFK